MKVRIFGKSNQLSKFQIVEIVSNTINKIEKKADNDEVEIIFADEKETKDFNFKYRKINRPTDVLSFPQAKFEFENCKSIIGSIVICEDFAKKIGESTNELIIHGILHLMGFDHEKDQAEWTKITSKISDGSV